jgi:hypothetical protein
MQNAGKNMRLYHQLGEVLRQFQAGGIPVIALKGIFLASVVYEEFALRPMGDIDLLVQWDDLARADKILLQGGYRPSRSVKIEKELRKLHHLPPYTRPQSTAIELHWSLVRPTSPLEIDLDGLWNRAQPASIASVPVLALAPEDLLLHLCTHYCQHAFRAGLRHLYDIVETLNFYQKKLVWEPLISRSIQWKTDKCLYLMLYLAQEMLGAQVPPPVSDALHPASFSPEIAHLATMRILNKGQSDNIHPNLAILWRDLPIKERATSLINGLFPFPEYIEQKYSLPPGSKKVYLYYLVRLKDLLKIYGGQVRSIARRETHAIDDIDQQNVLDDWWVCD